MNSILLLEDDFKMSSEIKLFFERNGFECEVVYDGSIFMKQLRTAPYDLYILDVNVPSMNGLEVCQTIRKTDPTTPILMLTAFNDVNDKVEALEFGADDYMVKPFHFDELLARVRALLRRGGNKQEEELDNSLQIANLKLDINDQKVYRGGKEISLTQKEYKLLELLANAKGRTINKQTIAEQVWDINFETGTNTIEVYINFLRNKIDKEYEPKLIHTRPGFGYYLKDIK